MLVAITGNYCSGKSSVANILRSQGSIVLDTDKIAKDCYSDPVCLLQFSEILAKYGLDKFDYRFTDAFFNNDLLRTEVENLIHAQVFNRINAFYSPDKNHLVYIEIPILFEKGYETKFDKVILVFTSDEVAVKRLSERNISRADFERRREKQTVFIRSAPKSHFIINNSFDIKTTEEQIKAIDILLNNKVEEEYGNTKH